MSQEINARLVETRMRDLAQTTVSQTVSLFKGGTFALAAVLLVEIVMQPDGRLLRLALWFTSFLLALTSYNAYLNTSVINFRESVSGVVIIIVQMMTELMLFATLEPRYAEEAWRFWFTIYAAFLLITAGRMLYFSMNQGIAVDADLKSILAAVERGRRTSSWRLVTAGVVALVFAIPINLLPLNSPLLTWLTFGVALFAAIQALNGLFGMHRQRVMMELMLSEALTRRAMG